MARLRSIAANATLVVAALVLVLVGLEAYFRLWSPQRSDLGDMFERHPELGWTFVADHRGAIVYPGEAAHYLRTNPQGFRDDSFEPRTASIRRVAVLGDSFVSNISVERSEVFTERLERSLSGVSVMNLGVNGYGQVQEILLLERVLQELSPDLVVVNVYLRNDFADNLSRWWSPRLARPTARLVPGGGVEIVPPPVRRESAGEMPVHTERSLTNALHTAHFLQRRLAFLLDRFRPLEDPEPVLESAPEEIPRTARRRRRLTPPELTLCAIPTDPVTDGAFRIMEALLLELTARARRAHVPIVFSLAPSMVQVIPDLWEDMEERARKEGRRLDATYPNRRLLAFAAANDLAMLDLFPALRETQARGELTYNRIEQHWTAAGNRVVAEALHDFLLRRDRTRAALGKGASRRQVSSP